jgi:apolipoprotein D and lipocalin family protein
MTSLHLLMRRGRAARMNLLAVGLFVALLLMPTPAAQSTSPVTTVDYVDLGRYVGTWFEIARFPNRFQRHCAGNVRATYTRRQDGRIDVINECRTENGSTSTARGIARIAEPRSQAKLKVRFAPAFLSFLPFVWGDYWVIGLADDYSWAVVGDPARQYLWLLSRTASLDATAYAQAMERARANGFDTTRLVPTRQN